ncbi:MAG: DUF47 family protein [Bacteroidia bacterium]|nr:DUF47 family protein [Bacteroidia bacterium]
MVKTTNPHERSALYSAIEEKEHKGDRITHKVFVELSSNFLTPIDRTDIHNIASITDDIADNILSICEKIELYKIKEISVQEIKLVELIRKCIVEIKGAVVLLGSSHNPLPIKKHCVNISSIENEAGKIVGHASKTLLENSADPIEQIKHFELIGILEDSIDKCEDMANSLEELITKMN